jgi:hypothetical protein
MAKIKGSMLLNFVKAIRSDKSGRFDKYLNEKDKKIVYGRVMANAWYPMETFINCFNAVFEELAEGNMETVREWGREFVDTTYSKIYRHLFIPTDARRAIKSREMMFDGLFESVQFEVDEISENGFIGTLKGFDRYFEPVYHMVAAVMERSLELGGAKGVEIRFLARRWKGDPETKMKFSWSRWTAPEQVQ